MKPKKTLIYLIATLLISCNSAEDKNMHHIMGQQTDEIFNDLIKIRRDLHKHPELAGEEKRTSATIAKHLTDLGLEVTTNVGGYGVVAILRGGKKGKNIAWRADMDALPQDFPDDVAFESTVAGVKHGCGHDIHMTIGLGIAEVLSKNKASLTGNIIFIFQPEEETFVGAKNMVNSDLFSDLKIDEVYALHVTALPVGQIMVRANEPFAYQKRIRITFNDAISKQELEILYDRIRNETLRKTDGGNPWEISMAFDTLVGLGNPKTVYKDYLFLEHQMEIVEDNDHLVLNSYAYETDRSLLNQMLPKIEQIILESEFKDNFISISFGQENPTVLNDSLLTKSAIDILTGIYGENSMVQGYGQIPYFNDDFIYFQRKSPGVYFLLGGSNPRKDIQAMNHAPDFRVDEESIRVAVKSFSSLLMERTPLSKTR